MRWSGSVALITGASRGIGREVARMAAARGARVALLARAKDELEQTLEAAGGNGAIAVADVADRAATEAAIEQLVRELGPVDILVNNAGIGMYGLFADADVEQIEQMIRVNYFGTVYATKAVLPSMLERSRGHIVNICSIAGRVPAPLEAAYSSTKFAMAGLNESLYFELAPRGIGVSMINPGPVATNFFDARGVPYKRPFPKPVTPERVAGAVMAAVERDIAEQFIPRWLRFPFTMKAIAPGPYRKGTQRNFRKDLA